MNISRTFGNLASVIRRLAVDDSGAELVEFAIAITLWISFFFAIFYFSLALYSAHFVANAAEEGARYAVVRGSSFSGTSCATSALACAATSSDVSSYIFSSLPPAIVPDNLTVSTTWPGTNSAGDTCDSADGANSPNCIVQVKVTYSFNYPIPFVSLNAMQMSTTSKMTIVN